MSEFKGGSNVANTGMTTKSVMAKEVRTVSQTPIEDMASFTDAVIASGGASAGMRSATAEDVKLLEAIGDDFMHESVVAHSLSLPSYLDVRPKDPTMEFRWVNFKGGEGRQLFTAKQLGFVKATPEDVLGEVDTAAVKNEDGGYVCVDVVLMKINKLMLMGYYKANVIKANRMAGKDHVHNEAVSKARSEFRGGLNNNEISYAQPRVSFYRPDKIPGEL